MKYFLSLMMFAATFVVNAETINDEPFYAFQDSKVFVEKDSMYRLDQAVVFKYRIDVDDGAHPWKTLTRLVRTQCDSNNFMNINATIVFKDSSKEPVEIKGSGDYIQYEPKSYRAQMTQYVCENAPH